MIKSKRMVKMIMVMRMRMPLALMVMVMVVMIIMMIMKVLNDKSKRIVIRKRGG